MTSSIVKHLSDKDAIMATREVTLNLKKNKDGDYKIVADDNLKEVLFANAEVFGEDVWWEVINLHKKGHHIT